MVLISQNIAIVSPEVILMEIGMGNKIAMAKGVLTLSRGNMAGNSGEILKKSLKFIHSVEEASPIILYFGFSGFLCLHHLVV